MNSRYIFRLKANTMRKKDSRRCVEPTGTEPAHPPVDLGALSGLKVKSQKGGPRFGTDLLHKGPEDGVAALVARLPNPLQNLLGRIIMLFQLGDDLAFERIEFAGTLRDRGSLIALPSGPTYARCSNPV